MKELEQKTLHVSMPIDLYMQLTRLAEESCRSRPAFIRQLLKQYILHESEVPNWRIK
ncbi:MAG: ribbon-helix-helix protein, CopG family [Oscillospiraceae bacterium]|nr:ribbon-helix-helix protein, CopG family [Oscillospiraceae bacterium]